MDKNINIPGPHRSFTKTIARADPMANLFARVVVGGADKYSVDEKIAYTNFRKHAYEMTRAKNRSGNIFGRSLNWLNGISHENLKISGAVLAEAIKMVKGEEPEDVNRSSDYVLDFDTAMELFEAFTHALREHGAFEDA